MNKKPPRYLHTRLEEVHIGAFFSSWRNVDFAVHLLKCAVALKRMVIETRYREYVGEGKFVSRNKNMTVEKIRKMVLDLLQENCLSENTEVIIL